jgi:hypothetical protein
MAASAPAAPVSTYDVAAKVDWEGGVIDTFRHGAFNEASFEDAELGEKWAAALALFKELEPVLDEIDDILEAVAPE